MYWDDKLWLAARNHNMYMHKTADFSHGESGRSGFYTGSQAENRVEYVTYNINEYDNASFENIALTGSAQSEEADYDLGYADDLSWEEMLEIARYDALSMFEMWKSSPGHNENMLYSENLAHGTSILYNDNTGLMYATSVFAQYQEYYNPDTLDLGFHEGWENDFKMEYEENNPEIKTFSVLKKRIHQKIYSNLVDLMIENNIPEDEKLKELIHDAPSEENDTQLEKRYLKNNSFSGFFTLLKNDMHQYVMVTSIPMDEDFLGNAVRWQNETIKSSNFLKNANAYAGLIEFTENNSGVCIIKLKIYTKAAKR
jgi:hypothetical protein